MSAVGQVASEMARPGPASSGQDIRLKADAERFLVSIEDAKNRRAYHDPNAGRETLGAFWQEVRATASRTGRLSERTLVAYDEIWRLYLEPGLGSHPLNAISRADVEDVVAGARLARPARGTSTRCCARSSGAR